MKNSREYTIFVVGIVIGLFGGYLFFAQGTDKAAQATEGSMMTDDSQMHAEDTGAMSNTTNEVVVNNQPAGDSVTIDSATLTKEAWIVIRDKNEDGEPGNILGAQLFTPETKTGTVSLLRNTIPDQSYYVAIYADDGDHEFEFKTDDKPVVDGLGDIILVEFHTYPTSPR